MKENVWATNRNLSKAKSKKPAVTNPLDAKLVSIVANMIAFAITIAREANGFMVQRGSPCWSSPLSVLSGSGASCSAQ